MMEIDISDVTDVFHEIVKFWYRLRVVKLHSPFLHLEGEIKHSDVVLKNRLGHKKIPISSINSCYFPFNSESWYDINCTDNIYTFTSTYWSETKVLANSNSLDLLCKYFISEIGDKTRICLGLDDLSLGLYEQGMNENTNFIEEGEQAKVVVGNDFIEVIPGVAKYLSHLIPMTNEEVFNFYTQGIPHEYYLPELNFIE